MKKQRNIGVWFIQASLFFAFICLHITINISIPDSKKLLGSATSIESGIISTDKENDSPVPWADPEKSAEHEADTISESISENSDINYPMFSLLKKRTNFRSDLQYPDHFELLSPPPETQG